MPPIMGQPPIMPLLLATHHARHALLTAHHAWLTTHHRSVAHHRHLLLALLHRHLLLGLLGQRRNHGTSDCQPDRECQLT